MIEEHVKLRQILHLETAVPHYTTLQKASRKLLQSKTARRLMKSVLKLYAEIAPNESSTISLFDSTGFETEHASSYFVWRKNSGKPDKTPLLFRKYPKLSLSSLPKIMMIVGGFVTRGPSTDMPYFERLLKTTCSYFMPQTVIADAGYDRELNHVLASERHIETIIPARAHCRGHFPKTPHRLRMKTAFPQKRYGLRWHVETVMSMLKRNLGARLFGQTFRSQTRELSLKMLTHNCMVV